MTGGSIEQAADLLRAGELVAVPTETVYGLAANALNEDAVVSVFRVKNRPFFDPLIIHCHDLGSVRKYVRELPPIAEKLANRFWPGPMTLLLYKSDIIPDIVTSGSDLVAVRIPAHPLTLNLLSILDFPIAAPSANPFGYISPTRAEHVAEQLGSELKYILDGGECGIGLESTIIDCSESELKVLRLGGLSLHDIEDCTGQKVKISINAGSNPSAPGQLDKHYSPLTPFLLTDDLQGTLLKNRHRNPAVLGFGDISVPEGVYVLNLSKTADMNEAARNLFHYMRLLDSLKPELIIAAKVPETGLGAAINDRMNRAAIK